MFDLKKEVKLRIVNTVYCAQLSKSFKLKRINKLFRKKLTYNVNKFSGIIFPKVLMRPKYESKAKFLVRKRRQGRGKVLMFANGKLIISGCLTEEEALQRVISLVDTIKLECEIVSIKLLNIVVAGCAETSLPLEYLFTQLRHWKSLELELFPALIVKRKNISYTLFRSGRYFATGIKTEGDVQRAERFFANINKILKYHRIQTTRINSI